ncbi:MAG TPA: branched-chain amino acid transport system II carrier protein [Paracoccus sp. (in: a-proteobacteria)]|nr:branched-chain amino acid transport system II carrier protein [Paracoccus sp. (in: a-proteobacteria)]
MDDGCCERAADVARHDCHEPCNVRGLLRGGQPVFPPHVGIQAGADRLPGQMDLLIAGMLLPTFGVVALGRGGGTFEPLARPIAPCLGTLLLGPLTLAAWPVTIARTAAVAHEADPALLVAAAADWAGRRFSRSSISSSRCISRSTSAA